MIGVGEELPDRFWAGLAEAELAVDVLDGYGDGPESLRAPMLEERLGGFEKGFRSHDDVVGPRPSTSPAAARNPPDFRRPYRRRIRQEIVAVGLGVEGRLAARFRARDATPDGALLRCVEQDARRREPGHRGRSLQIETSLQEAVLRHQEPRVRQHKPVDEDH